MMSDKNKKLLFITGLLILGFIIYEFFIAEQNVFPIIVKNPGMFGQFLIFVIFAAGTIYGIVKIFEKLKTLRRFMNIREIFLRRPDKKISYRLPRIFEQLSFLLERDVSLIEALEIIKSEENSGCTKILNHIMESLKNGKTFSDALLKYKNIIDDHIIALISVGEKMESLEKTIKIIAYNLKRKDLLRNKVKILLIYPLLTGFGSLFVISFILIGVLPTFIEMYEQSGIEISKITKICFYLSEYIRNDIGFLVLIIIGIICFYKLIMKLKITNKYLRIIPIIGNMKFLDREIKMFNLIFLAVKLNIPLQNILEVYQNTLKKGYLKNEMIKIQKKLETGLSITKSIEKSFCFSGLGKWFISAGEQSDSLIDNLDEIIKHRESELFNKADRLSVLLEPIFVIINATIIGLIVLSLFLPMFNIITLV